MVRAYVNHDTSLMYQRLFTTIFELLARILGKPYIPWKYLHGSGIGAIVSDMDSKQTAGSIFILK